MDSLQIIHSPTGEEMVVLPRAEYDRLIRHAPASARKNDENARDIAIFDEEVAKIKSGASIPFPRAVVNAILDEGLHPVRAWREYRGWTAAQLAKKTKVLRTTITQIETRKYKGTVKTYKAIAKALGVNLDNVVE